MDVSIGVRCIKFWLGRMADLTICIDVEWCRKSHIPYSTKEKWMFTLAMNNVIGASMQISVINDLSNHDFPRCSKGSLLYCFKGFI